MARLLAADIVAVLAHRLDDVAVAHRRSLQTEAEVLQIALKPEIGHHRGDDAAAGKAPTPEPGFGDDRHELITVDHLTLLVDDDHAVGVAVERDADIGAHLADLADEIARRGRAALLVDVEAVWIYPELDHFGAKLPQSQIG